MSACLDSWVVLAWLDGEAPACERIEGLIADRPVMSWVNAVEVYYRLERDHGRGAADDVVSELRIALDLELPGTARMIETARLKARPPNALRDCFAIAPAAAHHLPPLTGAPRSLGR